MDEALVFDHFNKSHWAELPFGAVYYAVQGGSNTLVCDHANESYRAIVDYNVQGNAHLLVDETLVCDHSSERYCAVHLFGGTVCNAVILVILYYKGCEWNLD